MAFLQHFAAHYIVGDEAVDLHRGDVVAAAGEGARNVPSSARTDDQRFRARPQGVGKAGTLVQQLEALTGRQAAVPIELRDSSAGVAVDDDGPTHALFPAHVLTGNGDAGKTVPQGREALRRELLALGGLNVDEVHLPVGHHQHHQQQRG